MAFDSAWLGVAVLMLSAIGCALLFRAVWRRDGSAPVTAWSILVGAIAGIVLGPTIFGRVAPDQYERWFMGGVAERTERERLIRHHDADIFAADMGRVDRNQVDQLRAAYEPKLAKATQLWREAQWKHQAPLRAVTLFIVACTLVCGGASVVSKGDARQRFLTPLTIGIWAVALPGGLTYAAMVFLWGFAPAPAALTAAVVTVGPWLLSPLDQEAADQAEMGGARMIQTAGRVASTLAIVIAMYAMWLQRDIEGLLLGVPLLALPVSWMVRASVRLLKPLIHAAALPALAATVTIKVELIEDFAFWPLIVLLLIIDDGRWLGALCGAMALGGRRLLRTMRLAVGMMSASVTQLAMLAVAVHAWAIPRQVVLPLVVGSLLIEFTYTMRWKLVQRLTVAEEQFSDQSEA